MFYRAACDNRSPWKKGGISVAGDRHRHERDDRSRRSFCEDVFSFLFFTLKVYERSVFCVEEYPVPSGPSKPSRVLLSIVTKLAVVGVAMTKVS